jgi:hypothetical protein
METPERERRWIEDYLRSQSGERFEIEHVEKLTSEYVMGREYDVWDAHTNEGRWWVITNPTNLYSQDAIKSMDVALSFHVGLMSRVLSAQPRRDHRGPDGWVLDVVRRLDVASAGLDRAKEVEDYQAVGMRLREALVSLGENLAGLGIHGDPAAAPPKRGDFKAWAGLAANAIASGQDNDELRTLLKATSERTWSYVNRLTHARRASELDGRLALGATSQVIESFITAVTRWRLGAPERCPACGSYQLTVDDAHDEWAQFCKMCGWKAAVEARPPTADRATLEQEPASPPEGDCVVIEDFGIYLTPQQARAMIEEAAERMQGEGGGWSSPFAVSLEDGTVVDAHRMAFEVGQGPVSPGVELVYDCGNDACVNPGHAVEEHLPAGEWMLGVIERARTHPGHVELRVSTSDGSSHDVFVDTSFLDRFGLADVSALAERLLLVSQTEAGWVCLVPAERRVDYGVTSIGEGWVHPPHDLPSNEPCPCGSERSYATCHGQGAAGQH